MKASEYREYLFKQHETAWSALQNWAKQIDRLILINAALLGAALTFFRDAAPTLMSFVSLASVMWLLMYRRAVRFYLLNSDYLALIRECISTLDGFNSYLYNQIHDDHSLVRYTVYEGMFLAGATFAATNVIVILLFLFLADGGQISSIEMKTSTVVWAFSIFFFGFFCIKPGYRHKINAKKREEALDHARALYTEQIADKAQPNKACMDSPRK